jgi:hypothetical protein
MKRSRTKAWLAAAISLLAVLVAGALLAQRVRAYNQDHPKRTPYFSLIDLTEFRFHGREVRLVDRLDEAGAGLLEVHYGDDIAAIEVGVPNPHPLPGLTRHEDWLRVMFVAPSEGRTYEEFEQAVNTGQIEPSLVLVSRHLNPGIDDSRFGLEVDTSSRERGETMRKRWTFGFLELLPDGGFKQWNKRFPESQRSFERRVMAASRAGEPKPERDPDELAEDSWEWHAALHVIPSGKAPNRTFQHDALIAAGWTLPVASAGIIGLMMSLALALAPTREQTWSRPSA